MIHDVFSLVKYGGNDVRRRRPHVMTFYILTMMTTTITTARKIR